MQCDQRAGFGHRELTFASTSETEVGNRRYLSPFCATDGRSSGQENLLSPTCQVFNDLPRLWFLRGSQKVSLP
jgi:hypothetical protein